MEPHHWLTITGYLAIIRMADVDHESIIRRQVEKHGLEITRWDIHEAVLLLCPGEDWDAEEEELWRILAESGEGVEPST